MEFKKIAVSKLTMNTGQIEGVPANPRQWTQADLDRLAASIEETPELLDARGAIVVPHKGKFVVLGGNMRLTAAKKLGLAEMPCAVLPEDTPIETLKAVVIKDNSSMGSWDYDALANEWHEFQLTDFGIPAWDAEREMERDAKKQMENGGLSSQGMEGGEGYDEFLDKFKQKLTTDDCYTPAPVYDAVLDFVAKNILPLDGIAVVRPFYPGGNYEDLSQYPQGCVVIDNPPFSIISKIIRFYCEHGIRFFIFAPQLTLFSAPDCDVTYIAANAAVTYENGAVVSTGFITNLVEDLRVWVCSDLYDAIEAAQEGEDKTKRGFVYPDNIITAATLGKLAVHGTEYKVRKKSCEYIKQSDSAEEQGRALYGGGFIMSDRAAAERAAAERAAAERAAAERAAATRLNLSKREKSIIARLNEQDKE